MIASGMFEVGMIEVRATDAALFADRCALSDPRIGIR